MRPGNKVTVKVDAWPDLELEGHVDSIQQGSGSKFSAFPSRMPPVTLSKSFSAYR
jgi:membrane fusion protein (multidrug efflux system)